MDTGLQHFCVTSDFLDLGYTIRGKDCPGLGNRSIFYRQSSVPVGITLRLDAADDTGSNVFSLVSTLARASLKAPPPGSDGIQTKRVSQRTVVHGGIDAPAPNVWREGECSKYYHGTGDRSIFYPNPHI